MAIVNLGDFGTATYEADSAGDWVEVGDRWIPRRIVVHSPMPNQPHLTMTIEVRQGIPVYTVVTLQARPDGPDVRKKDLDLPLDYWLEQIVAACSVVAVELDESGRPKRVRKKASDRRVAMANVRRARSGRPRMSPEHLQKVAEIYREHINDRPTEAVRLAFGKEHRTAARYVQQAREAGLLPPTTPGKRKA
ncbi:DUF6214 family protein [Mycobacterium sp. MUNTM1]